MTETRPAAFELEAATVEQILELLELREAQVAHDPRRMDAGVLRRAVFVAQLYDSKGTSMGVPSVKRYVVASFTVGDDLVTYTRITSNGIEIPRDPDREDLNKRQDAAYEEIRAEITGRIEARGWEVPVLEGFLHHSSDPRGDGRGRS